MMDPIAALSLTASLLAVIFSVVSVVLHWFNRSPRQLYSELQALRLDYLDLVDKVDHWRKRDSVRRARAGAEEKAEREAAEAQPLPDRATVKSHLRSVAASRGLGLPNVG